MEPAAQRPWRAPGEDSDWDVSRPLNAIKPDKVPSRPQGSIPVIVRVVWPTREELMPARAVRWTRDAVMVAITSPDGPNGGRELYTWLPAIDVRRTIPRSPPEGPQAGP